MKPKRKPRRWTDKEVKALLNDACGYFGETELYIEMAAKKHGLPFRAKRRVQPDNGCH